MENNIEKYTESAEFIRRKLFCKPEIAVILGSGLGSLLCDIENPVEIDYRDIPNFPVTTVQGHAGKLVSGIMGGCPALVMKGRFHYYEGYDIPQVVFHIRVFRLLGIRKLIITNAAGGINRSFKPGDLMIIRDHIGLFAPSPLRGRNLDEYGDRFPDMCGAYDSGMIEAAGKAAAELGIQIHEGVYAFAQGPMFETPAEIRALSIMGADAVGMSTVPEVITARHSGIKVLGISCITNMAAGILDRSLNHAEVIETAGVVEHDFRALLKRVIPYCYI